jgi:hypothetical protein
MSWVGAVVVLLAMSLLGATQARVPVAPRLLERRDLTYLGAFRLPSGERNGDSFAFGGTPMTYNPGNTSLFVGSRRGNAAEVSIPRPLVSSIATELPAAAFLQPFADPTEGRRSQIAGDGVAMSGLLVADNRLFGTGFIWYDAVNAQTVSHYSRSLTLSEPSVKGMYAVGDKGKTGFVAGYLAAVPPEWESLLGGAAITGQCCSPIISRTSWGPAAFAWNPARLGTVTPLPATPLLYYTGDHHTLGVWDSSSATYGGTTQVVGLAVIAGTRTALFFGRNGTGPYCYGAGTSDKRLQGTRGADGATYCYDPTSDDKGPHAYPYRYQIWAYDLNDLAAVKAGKRKPWDPEPYGVWPIDLPIDTPASQLGGVGYDPARQRLYVSQMKADQDGYEYRAIIHVFQLQ